MRSKTRSEEGATAILVALLAIVLFGVGALTIDVGHAYSKKRDLQTNVDLAVMAAAAELDGELADDGHANARAAAEEFLTKNEVTGQIPWDLGGSPTDSDGYIEFDGWKVRLYAPKVDVDWTFARVLGDSVGEGIEVPAQATAEVMSPGNSSSLPMYAVGGGCDYGNETISDAPAGHTDIEIPPLTPSSSPDQNAAEFTLDVDQIDAELTENVPLTLTGTNLGDVTAVGFTTAAGEHFEAASDGLTINGAGTSIAVDTIPQDVLNLQDFWFVRVKTSNGFWSPTDAAQMLIVGERLFCAGSVSGNYGSLRMPRDDAPSGKWLAMNIVKGMQPSLAMHPSPPADGDCKGDGLPTVESEHAPEDGTNCLATEPGFPGTALTDGLITGVSGEDGRLNTDTTPDCGRSGSNRTTATPTSPGVELNDDLLTCFITQDSTPISHLVAGTADNVLSGDILKSPRYFWIPVVADEPSMGACCRYPIIDFRPGFITDQPLTATKASPSTASMEPWAGVKFHTNKVESLRVILFDSSALPETAAPTGDEIAYTGSGTRILTLVD